MTNHKQLDRGDMSVLINRLSLIRRYNRCVGAPGLQAQQIQNEFINGFMAPLFVASFVAMYKAIIESRRPMHKLKG